MIKTKCNNCGQILYRSPSKVEPRNYCCRECYAETRNRELKQRGKKYQITPESYKKLSRKRIKALKEKTKGNKHYAWKGEKVSYPGLHMWLRRELGNPKICSNCGKEGNNRNIQWANIDNKYRRVLSDYIPLCSSCHKYYDRAMKSTQDFPLATQ